MAKKHATSKKLFDSQAAAPPMPEGYYSGDQSNLTLRRFVEEQGTLVDPDKDEYNVRAFTQPITTSKVTAIYNMHSYWSKKPHDAIQQYIRHYTKPGDIVLDPFCGSGSTALAALIEGRKAIAIDRSPAATFITKNHCTPVNVVALQSLFDRLLTSVSRELDWLYSTRCDRCGGEAITEYTVHSQTFQCPRCLSKVALFDTVEVEGVRAGGKPKSIAACPKCHEKGHTEQISVRTQRLGSIPVLTSYICRAGCKPGRNHRRHNDPDSKKRRFFKEHELAKMAEIEAGEIPHWYPKDRMLNAPPDQEAWGLLWRPYLRGIDHVHEFFTKRNLWALASLLAGIRKLDHELANLLLFVFNANVLNGTIMQQYREAGGGFAKGRTTSPPSSSNVISWDASKGSSATCWPG